MDLSAQSILFRADEFDMSLSTLLSNSVPTAGAEARNRRRSERTPRVLDAWICSPTAKVPLEEREVVTAVSMSRHGVAFTLAHALATNSFYRIEVGLGAQQVVCEVRIISCRKAEKGLFEVGAEFS